MRIIRKQLFSCCCPLMKIGFKIVPHVGEGKMDDYVSKCFRGCSSKQRWGNLFICLSSFAFCTIACEFITIIMVRRQCFFLIRSLWVHYAREGKGFLILDPKELNNTVLVHKRQMCILTTSYSSFYVGPFISCRAYSHIIFFLLA